MSPSPYLHIRRAELHAAGCSLRMALMASHASQRPRLTDRGCVAGYWSLRPLTDCGLVMVVRAERHRAVSAGYSTAPSQGPCPGPCPMAVPIPVPSRSQSQSLFCPGPTIPQVCVPHTVHGIHKILQCRRFAISPSSTTVLANLLL